jgi:hypothetical protein
MIRCSVFALLVFSLLAACQTIVGGPCHYEQHKGMAEVVGVSGDRYQLRFTLSPEPSVESHSNLQNGEAFYVRTSDVALAGAVVGSRYHAIASVITHGSCTPVSYEIGLAEAWVADTQACLQFRATADGASHFPRYQQVLKILDCAGMTKDVAGLDALDLDFLVMRARIYSLQELGEQETKTTPPRKYSDLTSAARLARFKQLVDSYYRSKAQ